jgi:hypothetical protein
MAVHKGVARLLRLVEAGALGAGTDLAGRLASREKYP